MNRPIAISLSPNTERDDVMLALKTLFSPFKWNDDKEVELLEQEFAQVFGNGYKAVAVNSGRSAQYLILKALGLGKGSEVALQAFTCVAAPNSVFWSGATPRYIDIDESYNISPDDLRKKINNKTRAVIVQNTFGISANIPEIKNICISNKLVLIEDCAHCLGTTFKGKPLGTFGDVAFFSFGRDKTISSVFGGIVLCSDRNLYNKIKSLRNKLKRPPTLWTLQQLFHPIAFSLILPTYNSGIGKIILFALQKAGLLSRAVYKEEKMGDRPSIFPTKMPGGLAILARKQLTKLRKFVSHRKTISKLYSSSLKKTGLIFPPHSAEDSLLRFPIRHKKAGELFKKAKRNGILLGDWYKGTIMPAVDLSLVGYHGDCPNAELFSETTINLPTYPSLTRDDVLKVIKLVKKWLNTQ
ncbi:DegT/DnrJ/EryC1/StrS family aminotransferase [Patescibacteria group bacterium]|nr:DegT/DnrJ/EryC1/StrS family aminotransferase [Patescibacteria group bacterium]